MSSFTTTTKLAVEIDNITPANVQQLKTLNINTLPVRYSDKFYRDLIEQGNQKYMKFAYWNGFTVGGVCARIETGENDTKRLYIMTINVLPSYRRRGIATALLRHVLTEASLDPSLSECYLHVQTSNDEARDFYLSHGFVNEGVIENYYKRIDPPHCFILRRKLEAAAATTSSAAAAADVGVDVVGAAVGDSVTA